MPRYSLKKLLAAVTVCGVVLSVAQTAGYLVAVSVTICVYLLVWALRSKRFGWMLLPRSFVGIVCVVAIWFLAVDWSWFIWGCSDCRSSEHICQYRLLGVPIYRDYYDEDVLISIFATVLKDLGKPCQHVNSGTWQKHRHWGLSVCAFPCWNGTLGLIGTESWYTESIAERVREKGRGDPEFAAEAFHQVVILDNPSFIWDACLADVRVLDSIENGDAIEAGKWLDATSHTNLHWLGDPNEIGEPYTLIQQIYLAGGREVSVIARKKLNLVMTGNSSYSEDDWQYEEAVRLKNSQLLTGEQATLLAIELPEDKESRKRIFAWAIKFRNRVGGFPLSDYGQDYVLFDLY